MNSDLIHPGLRWGFFAALLVAMGLLYLYRENLDIPQLRIWVETAGGLGALLFIGVFALGSVLMFSTTLLTFAGGVLFGPFVGTIYNLAGVILGAALAFLISRYLAADWLQRRTERRVRYLVDGVRREGWRYAAMLRLLPFFPVNLSNYLLGLTPIPFMVYLITSSVCLLPGTMAYTYVGYVGGQALSQGERGVNLVEQGLLAFGFVVLTGYLPRLLGLLGVGINIYSHQRDRKS